jgi:RHS repeat-associated protein
VTSIADGVASANSQNFGYDVLNRLTSAKGAYGSYSYTYDSVGNRLTQNLSGSTTSYSYAPRSNQLASVSAGGASQTIGYTKAGGVASFTPAAGAITNVNYNQAGRAASLMAGSNPAAQYIYDGFGNRLVKTGSSTTLYQYDQEGRILEETDGQGNPIVDYIYLYSLPVATLAPGMGQVYFLQTDRLGTPQAATDGGQNEVWSASYGPFGEMTAIPSLIVQNLRLPGQEFDADTGLYHNGFRDYAPGLGRYIQSDPLGLVAGLNTYTYVNANPVNATDRLGLTVAEEAYYDWLVVKTFFEDPQYRSQCTAAGKKWASELWDEFDLLKTIWDAAEEDLARLNLLQRLYKWGSSQPGYGVDQNSPYYCPNCSQPGPAPDPTPPLKTGDPQCPNCTPPPAPPLPKSTN